jgi:hypothetical protein
MAPRRLVLSGGLLLASAVFMGCPARNGPAVSPKVPAQLTPTASSEAPEHCDPKAVAAALEVANASIEISPGASTITADDLGLQLLASRKSGSTTRDVTAQVKWSVEPPGSADIEPGGYLYPKTEGAVTVKAAFEGHDALAKFNVEPRSSRTWDFAQDIVPVLTRLGCNTGACHGKANGQNGFHLSLFGYDHAGDYQGMARDEGQRRLSRMDPDGSLFLAKATGRVPHEGGPRLKIGSPEYQTLSGWVRDGAPELRGKPHGDVVRLSVEPGTRILAEPGPIQFRVVAHYSDGHDRDVTRLASFRVNDDSAASVSATGLVRLLERTETDLIVRYQSQVVATRLATVINPALSFDFAKLKRRNFIDDELFKRLESLKVPPSPPAGDAAFLRRAWLDLTGEQPSPETIRRFLADTDTDKRKKLVDQLLATPEFVLFWRIKLGDLLQISSARQGNGAYQYQAWIDNCLRKNRPWDEVVRTLLTAVGDPMDLEKGGPVNYALDALEANVLAEQTAQRFLGLRLRCAQCHDHPFDVWTQDAYFGLSAIFAKVERAGGGPNGRTTVKINPKGEIVHLRTKKPAEPRLLDGKAVKGAATDDPRKALADWMISADNPYFAKAMSNWVWAQLFGKGLVDPPDDLSRANPAVHPDLLDALAHHFVATKFDLRGLIRTVANSEAYALASSTVEGNERDTRLFSHHLPRPLTAHQMADALAQATDVPNRYPGVGNARRAIQVPDPMTASAILDTFGRCSRAASCGSTSAPTLTLRQALLLIGGDAIENKVTSLDGYLSNVLKLELEPGELVENLYFRTVCRPPNAEELSHWTAELKQASSLREAAEDLFWALLNSREFAFNH